MHIPAIPESRPARRTRRAAALLAATAALLALPAAAHGPTLRLAYDGLKPARLAIRVGQTVHFHNASTTPRTFTVQADDGSFESPPLPRGEGWHHTFESSGAFDLHVKEHPKLRATIFVAPEDR